MNTEKIYNDGLRRSEHIYSVASAQSENANAHFYSSSTGLANSRKSFAFTKEAALKYIVTFVSVVLMGAAIIYKIQSIQAERSTQSSPLKDFVFR